MPANVAGEIGGLWLWIGFALVISVMLAVDLGLHRRDDHEPSTRESLTWTAVWIGLALLFNLFLWIEFGSAKALEFFTGFVLEKAMSVDNLFVFLVLFTYFAVPKVQQHRVLFWGVVGAVAMRAIFIFAALALIDRFAWILVLLGIVLLLTGIKMLRHDNVEVQPEQNPMLRLFRRFVPMTSGYEGRHFLVRRDGRWLATPLALVLVVVETTDVAFAIDSIPAIIGITQDRFIVFTSNIFAILGLRALYFVLAGVMHQFRFLGKGLGLTLVFIAIKMLGHDAIHIPVWASLGVIALLVGGAVGLSVILPPPAPAQAGPEPRHETPTGPEPVPTAPGAAPAAEPTKPA